MERLTFHYEVRSIQERDHRTRFTKVTPCGSHDAGLAARLLGCGECNPTVLAKCHTAARSRLSLWLMRRAHWVRASRAARVRRTCSACSRANCFCARLPRDVIKRSADGCDG